MWNDLKPVYRFPVLILGMLSLVIGVLAGIGRLGVSVPQLAIDQMAYHGILMVPVFFGTVIGLERAVAIGQRWAYLAPLLTGIAGIVLLSGGSPTISLILILTGNSVFAIASIRILAIQYAIHSWILLAGALSLLVGNLILLFELTVNLAIYWWMSFLLLTIAGERLELSRLVIRSPAKRILLACLSMIPVLGATATLILANNKVGVLIFCIGMAAVAIWLISFDIARRTVRQTGLTRFTAVSMLAGYGWLLASAILLTGYELAWANASWDAALHSFFLGFVFSMVIGHALIIFPAVTGLKIPYSPVLYVPFILLHLSVLLRVVASLTNSIETLSQAGILNGLALALFLITLLWRIVRARKVRLNMFDHHS